MSEEYEYLGLYAHGERGSERVKLNEHIKKIYKDTTFITFTHNGFSLPIIIIALILFAFKRNQEYLKKFTDYNNTLKELRGKKQLYELLSRKYSLSENTKMQKYLYNNIRESKNPITSTTNASEEESNLLLQYYIFYKNKNLLLIDIIFDYIKNTNISLLNSEITNYSLLLLLYNIYNITNKQIISYLNNELLIKYINEYYKTILFLIFFYNHPEIQSSSNDYFINNIILQNTILDKEIILKLLLRFKLQDPKLQDPNNETIINYIDYFYNLYYMIIKKHIDKITIVDEIMEYIDIILESIYKSIIHMFTSYLNTSEKIHDDCDNDKLAIYIKDTYTQLYDSHTLHPLHNIISFFQFEDINDIILKILGIKIKFYYNGKMPPEYKITPDRNTENMGIINIPSLFKDLSLNNDDLISEILKIVSIEEKTPKIILDDKNKIYSLSRAYNLSEYLTHFFNFKKIKLPKIFFIFSCSSNFINSRLRSLKLIDTKLLPKRQRLDSPIHSSRTDSSFQSEKKYLKYKHKYIKLKNYIKNNYIY